MDFDFNLILVPITLGLGVIWLADKLVLKQRKTKGKGKESLPVNWAYDFFPVLAFVLVIRSFLIEPFNIPSSSMVPTLHTGDFIAVNKYAYGVRLPLSYTKVIDTGSPKHGDVAVFRYPQNPKQYYIKRVIALPGDTISYDDRQLSINDKPIPVKVVKFKPEQVLIDNIVAQGAEVNGIRLNKNQSIAVSKQQEADATYVQEQHGEHSYLTRYWTDFEVSSMAAFLQQNASEVMTSEGKKWQITVPESNYFVMGDNRDSSADSRFWGFVPEENLAGKAVYVWMHKQAGLSNMPSFSRNGRIE